MADERPAIDPAEIVETVKVKDAKAPGGFRVINADEFDEKKDHKYTEPKAASDDAGDDDETDTRNRAELVEAAESKGLHVKSGATKADIAALLDLEALPKAELIEKAKAAGLDTTGAKADLVNRLGAS